MHAYARIPVITQSHLTKARSIIHLVEHCMSVELYSPAISSRSSKMEVVGGGGTGWPQSKAPPPISCNPIGIKLGAFEPIGPPCLSL